MKHLSLFSGIGGFDLAAEWMGWQNVAHCEMNPFGQRVLAYYWPEAELIADVTETHKFDKYADKIDILTGGFPCQPYSSAGLRKGKDDERHLWPAMLAVIRTIRPRWIVGENVRGLVNWSKGLVFEEVCADLEAEGYSVQPFILPAAGVNAPHKRERVWFVAYPSSIRRRRRDSSKRNRTDGQRIMGQSKRHHRHQVWRKIARCGRPSSYSSSIRRRRRNGQTPKGRQKQGVRNEAFNKPSSWQAFPTQSPVFSGNDGLPGRLDAAALSFGGKPPKNPAGRWVKESLKAAGNAIVPQVALQIFKAIEDYEKQQP